MTPATRLGVYSLVLAATFAGGAAVGTALGPIGDDPPASEPATEAPAPSGHDTAPRGGFHGHGR